MFLNFKVSTRTQSDFRGKDKYGVQDRIIHCEMAYYLNKKKGEIGTKI